ncbi:MAG: VanZ family protein [Candidatus Omnitrophota bacterium]
MSAYDYRLKHFFRDWRWVIAYVCVIYVTLPIMPPVMNYAATFLGKVFTFIPLILLLLSGALLLYYLVFFLRLRNVLLYGYCAAIFLIALIILINIKLTVERIHIFEYGILPFLIKPSLIRRNARGPQHIKVFLIGLGIGIIDELIQLMLPNRFFAVSDIMINGISVLLGVFIVGILDRARSIKVRIS